MNSLRMCIYITYIYNVIINCVSSTKYITACFISFFFMSQTTPTSKGYVFFKN